MVVLLLNFRDPWKKKRKKRVPFDKPLPLGPWQPYSEGRLCSLREEHRREYRTRRSRRRFGRDVDVRSVGRIRQCRRYMRRSDGRRGGWFGLDLHMRRIGRGFPLCRRDCKVVSLFFSHSPSFLRTLRDHRQSGRCNGRAIVELLTFLDLVMMMLVVTALVAVFPRP